MNVEEDGTTRKEASEVSFTVRYVLMMRINELKTCQSIYSLNLLLDATERV